MKKTLTAICLLAAMPALFVPFVAGATTVPDEAGSDSSVAASLPRGPADPSGRNVPLNGVPVAPSAAAEKHFRYMDMADVKRARGLRRAVIVVGHQRGHNSCSPSYRSGGSDDAPEIRRPSQQGKPVVVMRPMT